MSSTNERMTDLFIPIHRPQSSTSSNSTSVAATATTTVPSASTTPTTVSSRKSNRNTTPGIVAAGSPSSVRYTINGPAPELSAPQVENTIRDQNPDVHPVAVHSRNHSRKLSLKASPIQVLSMRLSKATENNVSSSAQEPLHGGVSSQYAARSKPISEPGISILPPTPISLSKTISTQHTGSVQPVQPQHSVSTEQARPDMSQSTSASKQVTRNLASPLHLRSSSRGSNRSDSSFPPPSFPTDFYDRSLEQQSPNNTPPRVRGAARTSRTSSRSTSPLKHQVYNSPSLSLSSEASNVRPLQRHASTHSRYTAPRVNHNPSGSISQRSQQVSSFHATVHQYSSCPHTCPPSTRPLDISPVLDDKYSPPISMLSGSCFDCDTFDRRESESLFLESYNLRISAHMADLTSIVEDLEAMSPVSPLEPTAPSEQFGHLTLGDSLAPRIHRRLLSTEQAGRGRCISHCSFVSEDEDGVAVAVRMQALQDRIAELTALRDKEIKDLWRGYTQRWGPGTLGIVKNIEASDAGVATPGSVQSTRTSMDSERSYQRTAEGRMKVDWIRNKESD